MYTKEQIDTKISGAVRNPMDCLSNFFIFYFPMCYVFFLFLYMTGLLTIRAPSWLGRMKPLYTCMPEEKTKKKKTTTVFLRPSAAPVSISLPQYRSLHRFDLINGSIRWDKIKLILSMFTNYYSSFWNHSDVLISGVPCHCTN